MEYPKTITLGKKDSDDLVNIHNELGDKIIGITPNREMNTELCRRYNAYNALTANYESVLDKCVAQQARIEKLEDALKTTGGQLSTSRRYSKAGRVSMAMSALMTAQITIEQALEE